jgi:hypothetical protein
VAVELLSRGLQEPAGLGMRVDVDERRQRPDCVLGRLYDSRRRGGIEEIVLVPGCAELRG